MTWFSFYDIQRIYFVFQEVLIYWSYNIQIFYCLINFELLWLCKSSLGKYSLTLKLWGFKDKQVTIFVFKVMNFWYMKNYSRKCVLKRRYSLVLLNVQTFCLFEKFFFKYTSKIRSMEKIIFWVLKFVDIFLYLKASFSIKCALKSISLDF